MPRKQKIPEHILTAQEFINVEDIEDGLLYSLDGHLFGYLSIRARDGKLLSEQERVAGASALAAALGGENYPWQLLSVPRTLDNHGMIDHLVELRKIAREEARLKLINGEITALQTLAREGIKEPMIVLKTWLKASKGADQELKKRLLGLRNLLIDRGISCELMTSQEVTYLCKVFADLSDYQEAGESTFEDLPILKGQTRRWSAGPAEGGLLELITPMGGLRFGVSTVSVGGVIGRVYGACRWPSELDYGWCVDLMNGSDCITCITWQPGDAALLGDALSRSIPKNAVDAAAETDARRRKRLERKAADADRLIEELDFKNAALGHFSMLVMPFTGREDELDEVCRAVVARFGKKRIKLKPLGSLQKEAYRQLSPYHVDQPEIGDVVRRILPLETLMGGDPMTVNIYRDDRGCYFGRTMDGGVISLDLLYRGRDRTNGNIVATGATGRGKSTALKHIIQSLYMTGIKVIIIDPEGEYKELCRNLSGTWLDAGGGTAKVNPLQIRPVPGDEEEDTSQLYRAADNAMALHIHTLEVFFKLYLPSLTDLQMASLKQLLVELYQASGLDWDTDPATVAESAYPLCQSLYALAQEKAQTDQRFEGLAPLLYDMAEGADSFLWNGLTNVDLQNDFIVLDTSRLQNSSDEIKRAQYFNLLTLCWQMMSASRSQPVFLLADEAHILLDPAIPQTAMFLRNMAKRARKYEAMLCTVMQSVVDALDDRIKLYGQAILDNASYKLMFGTDGRNLQETAALFGLTEAEQSILLSGERGKALCFLGNHHVHVDFDIPQYKLDLMGSGGGR